MKFFIYFLLLFQACGYFSHRNQEQKTVVDEKYSYGGVLKHFNSKKEVDFYSKQLEKKYWVLPKEEARSRYMSFEDQEVSYYTKGHVYWGKTLMVLENGEAIIEYKDFLNKKKWLSFDLNYLFSDNGPNKVLGISVTEFENMRVGGLFKRLKIFKIYSNGIIVLKDSKKQLFVMNNNSFIKKSHTTRYPASY